MAAAPLAGSITWIWFLMLGGLGGVPMTGPPLPLDPQMSAITPADCLWYASSSGQGEASAESSNHAEQLFAEPQIREFIDDLETQILRAVRRAAGPGREQRVLASEMPVIIKALITRPTVAYLEHVAPREDGVDVEAAFVLNAGEQRSDVEASIRRLVELAGDNMPPMETETVANIEWQKVATPPQAPAIRFGWRDEYLILAVGEQTPAKLVERMSGSAPQWLADLRDEHPVAREASLSYVNIGKIVEIVRPFAQQHEAWAVVEQLGLFSIREIHGIAGFDETGCVATAHIVTDGQRQGLLGLLPYKPLSKRDLRPVPQDALIAFAGRLDAEEVFSEAIRMVSRFEPEVEERIDRDLWDFESETGIDVRGDILDSLDDVWLTYLPSGDLFTSWINAAAAVRVKDADRLGEAIDKLVDVAQREMSRGSRNETAIVESHSGGHVIYSIQFLGGPAPVSPSWCVGDDWLVVGLLPSSVRAVLDRKAEDSLADVDRVRDALSTADGPAVLAYQNTPQLVRMVYPWIQIGLNMLSGQLRQEGIEIDVAALPSVDVIAKHLQPDVATLTHSADGFHFHARSSLPGGGNLASAAPLVVALGLPAVTSARAAAQVTTDINSAKQIALAIHNYESAYGEFPTNIYDEEGNALLSWRVRLLPFLEEGGLYEQFRLDESWDSEHNLRLADQIPFVYMSQSEPPIDSGRTRFLAFQHESSVFPGQQAMKFARVRDGTSNTLMFVQASPAAAVEWSRPHDIDFDRDRPFNGLESHEGSFIAARCDGSVFQFELSAGAEVLRAMVTRNGGEAIKYDRR